MALRPAVATTLFLTGLAGSNCLPASAQEKALSWSDYRLGQLIASRGRTPGEILALDNNGEILLACRDGCSPASLEAAGVPALASQLELLRGWALLVEGENGLAAGIPILDAAASELLAERASRIADALAESAAAEVAEVVGALEAEGLRDHAFSVIFSYVLDGEVWEYFDELSLVKRRNVARRGAPWGGEAWAYVSGRERELRTSSLYRGPVAVKVSWVEALGPRIESLLTGPQSLLTLFADFLEKGQPESPELKARMMEYGILGPGREFTLPVVEESPGNPLFEICGRLTARVAETVNAQLDRAALVRELGLESESQALVMAYHEVMWGLMERLVEAGKVELPAPIADPSGAREADLGRLVVIVRAPVTETAGGGRDGG